jgi:methylated-DNA-protein-cysteine methyltransferase-like protein
MKNESFFQDVYEVVRLIPEGRATSYGAIAEYLGLKRGARMVGWAMNSCHGLDVPAHRVVNRDGLLTGKHFFPAPHTMQELLEREGVVVVGDKIQDFDRVFWSPSDHLLL